VGHTPQHSSGTVCGEGPTRSSERAMDLPRLLFQHSFFSVCLKHGGQRQFASEDVAEEGCLYTAGVDKWNLHQVILRGLISFILYLLDALFFFKNLHHVKHRKELTLTL